MKRNCPQCNATITGRTDKKFCSTACKTKHHNAIRLPDADIVKEIDWFLHNNRHILMVLSGQKSKIMLPRIVLDQAGFRFNYFTGTYTNNKGKVYYYVYDFAWMEFSTQEIMIVRKIN